MKGDPLDANEETQRAVPEEPAEGEQDRLAEPVDDEQPPRLPFPVIGIGASAGGLDTLTAFLDATKADSGMAYVVIQHLPPERDSLMAELLSRHTRMPVHQVEDGMPVEPNHLYVIRPGHVLTIREGRLRLGPPLGTRRSANRPIDDFFRSLAQEQRERAGCIVMSGMGSNGAAGAQAIKAVGGLCIAQDPDSAQYPSMPRHLIEAGYADFILKPAEMPDILTSYFRQPYSSGGREADAQEILVDEEQHLREIVAILRTRNRHNFSSYKQATLLRRIQRRMTLARTPDMAAYARLLRQSSTELTALADDLLIHITGFFRDPESWEALRQRVIAPLVASREPGDTVRAWVVACSSGEEAYSLAMLLVEESEKASKHLDIKVFATDLAERTLTQARVGSYPGGIESEILPERLDRFFTKDDEMYRVRPALRDRVVFAPQNVLQDPPFSRLDIATCRNLLIYLEPDAQHRLLALLHFGLRDKGVLFLGSNETISGAEDLYEAIDKRARIFRRVGPTRHGTIDAPMLQALAGGYEGGRRWVAEGGGEPASGESGRQWSRASVSQMTERVLLDEHTPPSVTVDRDSRILYYHGDTRRFLRQPSGEPTRELNLLLREGMRGAVREAMQRATEEGTRTVVDEGWVEVEAGRRLRVAVAVSPVYSRGAADDTSIPPDYFVLSFEERGEAAPLAARSDAINRAEVNRLRAELQSTIEELQTSNEELKASNEEVTSMNEELQSTNEELETSKEEMQSLNEELTTVNAQLRVKMDEHLAASSDLASLLASTDIAVLFLDTSFRIRRFTPAFRGLVDVISSDVGRPLTALARRFDDPNLDEDARTVLERLVPIEREVAGNDGRHFLRRILPYRTTDNRIDGVVLTFIDITARKRAEEQTARQSAALGGINRIFREALASRGETELAQACLAAAENATGSTFSFMGMLDPDTGRLGELISSGRISRTIAADRVSLPFEEILRDSEVQGIFRRALVDGVGFYTNDPEPQPDAAGSPNGQKLLASFLGVPLVNQGRTIGMMGLGNREGGFSATELEMAESLSPAVVHALLHKRAETALKESEVRLKQALSIETVGVLFYHLDGRINDANPAFEQMSGYRLEELKQMESWRQLTPPEHQAATEVAVRELTERGATAAYEKELFRKDGSRWWGVCAATRLDGEKRGSECVEFVVDTTARKRTEEALRESKDQLQLVLSAARMGTWILDAADDAHTRDANLNALMGLEAAETRTSLAEFLTHVHPEDRNLVSEAFQAAGGQGRPLNIEFRIVRPDGAVRWLRDRGNRFPGGEGQPPHLAGACVDVTDLKEAEEALRRSHNELEQRVAQRTAELARANDVLRATMAERTELLRRVVTAQEDERRRVSRELHDGIGQSLTTLMLDLGALARRLPKGTPGHEQLAEIEAAVGRVSHEAHNIAVDLRPTVLDDLGLAPALAEYVSRWSDRSGVQSEFQTSGMEGDRIPADVETAVYRVVQEALSNVAKHAGARHVSVILERRGDQLTVLVEDDGQGFDPEQYAAASRKGLGLLGMRERASLVGGTLHIEAAKGEGTTVRVRIPVGLTTEATDDA